MQQDQTIHVETEDEETDDYSNDPNFCFEDSHVDGNDGMASNVVYIGGIDNLI